MNRSSITVWLLLISVCSQALASVEVTSFSVNERDGTASATVTLSSSPGAGWLLDYNTRDNTAEDEGGDNDYTATAGTLTFGPGDTEETVDIPIIEDEKIEGDEDFYLDVFDLRSQTSPESSDLDTRTTSSSGKVTKDSVPVIGATGTITIEDNDTLLYVNIEFVGGDETQAEVTLTCNSGDVGDSGTTTSSKLADETDSNTAAFTVINYGPAELLCTGSQTNEPPAGYSDTTGTDCDSGFNQSSDSCLVQNTLTLDDELRNKSGRADVGVGDNIEIAGFIIVGEGPKCVVLRGRGPSVSVPEGTSRLADPILTLKSGSTTLAQNDDWMEQDDPDDLTQIQNIGVAPGDTKDAAIYECLDPGAYTALLQGKNGGTGVGIVEVLDVDNAAPYLFNISARARVGTGDLVTIGGFIIAGDRTKQILIRGRGPSVAVPDGVPRLSDPIITLKSGATTLLENDDWGDAANAAEITATGKAPTDPAESAILLELSPGPYTVILRGVGGETGSGIIEIFDLTGR